MSDEQLLDGGMSAQDIRLHMGEMSAQEVRTARAAIRWANRRATAALAARDAEIERLKALLRDRDAKVARLYQREIVRRNPEDFGPGSNPLDEPTQ